MTTFKELDAYLSQDFSDDYWADDASLYACELIKQLTAQDWNALKSSWQNRSKQWQVRCAEILDWGDARQAVPLLLEMIQREDDELTLTAADSLSSIGVAELDLPLGADILSRLQAVAMEDDELTLTAANSLSSIGVAELDLPLGADILSRLQAVANSGNVAKLIINKLLQQLQVQSVEKLKKREALTGEALLKKVKKLGNLSKEDKARACGYYTVTKNGVERINMMKFLNALIDAEGIQLNGSQQESIHRGCRSVSYRISVQANGNLIIGSAYTKQMGLSPGDEFEISLGRKHIHLRQLDREEVQESEGELTFRAEIRRATKERSHLSPSASAPPIH